jgi:hypothetical protein
MKIKRILVTALLLVFAVSALCLAEEMPRKKVVKVSPNLIEEQPTTSKTEAIRPSKLEESGSTSSGSSSSPSHSSAGGTIYSNPPEVKPVMDRASGEDKSSNKNLVNGPRGISLALKGGLGTPRYLAGLESGLTLLPGIMERLDLGTRAGVSYQRGFGISAWSVYGDLFLSWDCLRCASFPVTLTAGGGINYPFANDQNSSGKIGYNGFFSINYDLDRWFQIFFETGVTTLAIENLTTRRNISLLLGSRIYF